MRRINSAPVIAFVRGPVSVALRGKNPILSPGFRLHGSRGGDQTMSLPRGPSGDEPNVRLLKGTDRRRGRSEPPRLLALSELPQPPDYLSEAARREWVAT